MLLYAVLTCYGIGWGLPSHADDRYLFAGEPWPAERLAEAAAARLDPALGADVDVDPLAARAEPVVLNATTTGVAEIVRRYRLFTRQPDEMITIMALSGMRPRALQLDPRLYQYGGLFIYPVGAAIGACGALGVYPVTSDPAYYLANPASFGKFYITARAFAAAWGLVGIVVMYELARRIAGRGAGLLAALLFVLLPVVTCMAHEAKPHLPGAVLMLLACLLAMRALDLQRNRDWLALFVCCGAAVGMVLSAAPIVLLIPLAIGTHCVNQTRRQQNEFPTCTRHHVNYRPIFIRATIGGWLVAGAIYLLTNPYIVINLFANRAVLRSNFGNSLAMYQITHLFAGARRVIELTAAGATWPVLLFGITGGVWALRHRTRVALPLGVMALLLALQFVLLGAGKPDEYGRFGVFTNCALAVSAACFIAVTASRSRALATFVGIITVAVCAWTTAGYLAGFRADAQRAGSRDRAAAWIAEHCPATPVALTAEPAPYGCPPLAFDRTAVVLYRLSAAERPIDAARRWNSALRAGAATVPPLLVTTCDDPAAFIAAMGAPAWTDTQIFAPRPPWLPPSRISWANKPVVVLHR
ncbi:MAG TPA: glycosyltransferase family 39 protein [Phycisphaerae bacterium]|nr:glycosyltransferase family 39 protein [Phycisphaerae bacterium]